MKIIKLDLNYPSLAGNNDNGDADDNDLGQQKALQTVKYNPVLQMTIKLRPSAGLSATVSYNSNTVIVIKVRPSAGVATKLTTMSSVQNNFIQELGDITVKLQLCDCNQTETVCILQACLLQNNFIWGQDLNEPVL